MNITTQNLTAMVSQAFGQCGFDETLGTVVWSDRPDLSQYQANGAFVAAKIYKISPMYVAQKVAAVLEKNNIFSDVTITKPGFINLSIKDEYLIESVNQILSDKYLGIEQIGNQQTIMIDYGGPNIAKPLHVGHLRSAVIGESLKRIAKDVGYRVISDVHLGDWGMPMGLVIAELENRYGLDTEKIIENLSIDKLEEIYPLASQKSKDNPEFEKKAHSITLALQNNQADYLAIWKEIIKISVENLKQSYSKLNVQFDLWKGESDAQEYISELIEILDKRGLLSRDDGALVVELSSFDDTEPIPPIIIKKSNDASLYSTTDLATIIQRHKQIMPDKYWYVVDNRQSLHFKQVFRCVRKACLVPESTEMEFLGFGTVNNRDGKPYKSRDGGVMKLSDLLDIVTSVVIEKIQIKDSELKRDIAEKIGTAAIKFGDLVNNRSKNYIFDLDKFLATDGKTGAYILYTISRINSIQKKVNIDISKCELAEIYSADERQILLDILSVADAFKAAILEKDPHYICESAYKIASSFAKFYNNVKIISEKSEKKRNSMLSLIHIVKTFLVKHLDVLAIEPVDQM